MSDQGHPAPKRHLLAVLLEDYFQVGAFTRIIQRTKWDRFEARFERNTLAALDLLDRFQTKATFFVLGWIARQQPELIREVARRGHEIASRGYYNQSVRQMTRSELREDLARARETLEGASETKVWGYRAAHRLYAPADSWVLEVLAEEGYLYDASLVPTSHSCRVNPSSRFAHQLDFNGRKLWEFPVSSLKLPGWLMPIAGGNYFRQFPHTLVKQAVEYWHRNYDAPFAMYFHVWELDPQQPRISSASPLAKIRHYRNLNKMSWVMADYLSKYQFARFIDYPGLSPDPLTRSHCDLKDEAVVISHAARQLGSIRATRPVGAESFSVLSSESKIPITIVIPCFNEESSLPYLFNTLKDVEITLAEEYEIKFIFVDDGSTDQTWDSLQQLFGSQQNVSILQHPKNAGVAVAILAGIRQAQTEIVCSMDCDCSYDPHELKNMIPLLSEGVDLVTASPYHPQGKVLNVPSWRLALSKTASLLYRQVLQQQLFTYTSCFRVYRRSAVAGLSLREGGFLGIAELLGKLDLQGARIVEYPTTLEVRLFGQSKMKTLRTIMGHLGLLARLLACRARLNLFPGRGAFKPGLKPGVVIKSNLKAHSDTPPQEYS